MAMIEEIGQNQPVHYCMHHSVHDEPFKGSAEEVKEHKKNCWSEEEMMECVTVN